jgi:hypothetical protein
MQDFDPAWLRPFTFKHIFGIPQELVLSVTLHSIAINGITCRVHCLVMCSLNGDDFAINLVQLSINWLSQLRLENVFKIFVREDHVSISADAGECSHIPTFFMDNSLLAFAETIRLLGHILGSHLSWVPHILRVA